MKIRFAVSVGLGPPDPLQLAELAEEAEQRGFDTLWMSDLPLLPAAQPALGLAYVAARTKRVRLGGNFIPFGVEPYLFAHHLAHLDRLSGGRLLVTLVPGLEGIEERRALATVGRHRGRMMDALVPALRRWWVGEPAGEAGLALPVVPVQQPLEIWLGGSGPEARSRAGRLADGWLGSLLSPGRAEMVRRSIDDEATRAGRRIDPEHFGLSIAYARRGEDWENAVRLRRSVRHGDEDPQRLVPVGAPELRRFVGRLVDVGLSKFVVRPLAPVSSTPQWSDELAWLSDTLLDLQT